VNEPQPNTRPSTDDRDHLKVDAAHYPEAYGLVDGNGQRFPASCAYAPLAIANSPAYQALLSRSIGFATTAKQWSSIAGEFIEARRSVRAARPYTPEQEELIESMASALGAGIAKAMQHRDTNRNDADAVRDKLAEMEQPESERRRANPDSNSSGMAIIDASHQAKCERIDKDGCCFGYGKCPKVSEVESAVKFTTGYIQWVDNAQEQSGLAAVAARLSPVSELES
jgi:hypothetical protein